MKIQPMLCKRGDKNDLDKPNYIFEPKLDGTRAICYINKEIELINRRGINITKRYPEFNFRQNVNSSCILDGEIIVYGKDGMPNFNLLQKREQLEKEILIELRSKEIPATFVVFDILMKDGKNLINYPLKERKKRLISAFLLGLYDHGQLKYIGKVGTGFTEKFLQQIFKKISKITISSSPVKDLKNINARWISPKLVGEIKYL